MAVGYAGKIWCATDGSCSYHRSSQGPHKTAPRHTMHRRVGPSNITSSGTVEYHENGYVHRDGGPACYDPHCGVYGYWILGRCCSADEYLTAQIKSV